MVEGTRLGDIADYLERHVGLEGLVERRNDEVALFR